MPFTPASANPSATATKRLLHELRALHSSADGNPAVEYLRPLHEDNLFEWEAGLRGPEGSCYDGAIFPLRLTIPPIYPLHPPILTFTHPSQNSTTFPRHSFPIHANIHPHTGALCLDLLSTAWSPAYTLSSVCTAAQQVLLSPEADSPLDVDVAGLLRKGDGVALEGLVRLWAFGGGVG